MKGQVIGGARTLGRAEASDLIPRMAALFCRAGLGPEAPITLATADDPTLLCAVLAARHAGIPALILEPTAPAAELGRALQASGARGLVMDPDVAERWGEATSKLRTWTVRPSRPTLWQQLLGKVPPPAPDELPGAASREEPLAKQVEDPDATAIILPTSGSVGLPRWVPWTNGALDAQLHTLKAALELGASDRILNLLPSSHYDGLVMGNLLAWSAEARVTRLGGGVAGRLSEALDLLWRERITHLVAAPPVLALLARLGPELREAIPEDLRWIVSTAAPLTETLREALQSLSGRPVLNVYGLTETGNLFFAGPDEAGTVGRPRDVLARLVAEDGAEAEEGELWLSGPSVLRRWLDGESPLVARDGRRWLPTGDLARRDAEGRYAIIGRKKRMISVGGLKVSPEEVEAALLGHPAVADALVLPVDDELLGERVEALVVWRGEPPPDPLQGLGASVVDYKLPRRIIGVAAIPRNRTGKPDLLAARALLAEPVAAPSFSVERLYVLAAACFRVPRATLGPGSSPDRVPGWDSVAWLELVGALERELAVRLGARGLASARTLGDLERLVRAAAGFRP